MVNMDYTSVREENISNSTMWHRRSALYLFTLKFPQKVLIEGLSKGVAHNGTDTVCEQITHRV